MTNILDMNFKGLKTSIVNNEMPSRMAYQIYGWVYRQSVFDFDEMSDISKVHRPILAEKYQIISLETEEIVASQDNEAIKFLFKTHDGHFIESVLLLGEDYDEDSKNNSPHRLTICVSSQVGCALSCNFCATGRMGFTRNLVAHEILSQILLVDAYAKKKFNYQEKGRILSNIVFMGMGEPLQNFDEVMTSIHIMNFSGGFNLGMRHITISTAGIVPKIIELADRKMQLRLAVSLNSAIQDKRLVLMPVTLRYPTKDLLDAVRYYVDQTNRRVTLEYVLIDGINDEEKDVVALKRALYKLKYNLNLIVYNPVDSIPLSRPNPKKVKQFEGFLKKHGIPYVRRFSKGGEIAAGCGQLGATRKKDNR